MSAAVDNFKKGWLLAVFSLASTVIGVVVAQTMSDSSASKKDLYDKIDRKADRDYVDQRFEEYEKIQKAHYQGIYDMFSITNDQLKEIRADLREIKK